MSFLNLSLAMIVVCALLMVSDDSAFLAVALNVLASSGRV